MTQQQGENAPHQNISGLSYPVFQPEIAPSRATAGISSLSAKTAKHNSFQVTGIPHRAAHQTKNVLSQNIYCDSLNPFLKANRMQA